VRGNVQVKDFLCLFCANVLVFEQEVQERGLYQDKKKAISILVWIRQETTHLKRNTSPDDIGACDRVETVPQHAGHVFLGWEEEGVERDAGTPMCGGWARAVGFKYGEDPGGCGGGRSFPA
jgi:hypothetical protein